jgi:hypothetical protein
MILGQGVTINGSPLTAAQVAWPNYNPGFYPLGGVFPGAGPQYYDQNAGRPARQYQWSLAVQREIARNLVVQVAYVGNRGIWWPTYVGSALTNYNYLSTSILSQYGLNLNNPADVTILASTLSSPAAGRFQNQVPFAGFPLGQTVAQSLRPFPQFTTIGIVNAPLGGSWYNGLQLTANKRLSSGLQVDFGFTWSKSIDTFAGTPDVQNRGLAKGLSSLDQPLVTRIGVSYTTPKWEVNKVVSHAVRDWTLGVYANYASGIPLPAPLTNTTGYVGLPSTATINNIAFQTGQYQLRTGQPLYLQDLNCHCFDPNTTIALNPAAWANPAPGQYGGQQYYGDYRSQRRPSEVISFGRQFRIKERATLGIRAEFADALNRTYLNNPGLGNLTITPSPQTAPSCRQPNGASGTCSPGLQVLSGFGSYNTSTVNAGPRTGQLVAQFTF